MKKKIMVGIIVIIVLAIIALVTLYFIDRQRMEEGKGVLFSTWGMAYAPIQHTGTETHNMKLILSLEDEITENSAWCGTFNLIWNDLKNELAKQDILFKEGNPTVVNNLNRGTFNTSYLSENSYYKVCEVKRPELKEQIEKAIKEKFNETSNILDDFDWNSYSDGVDYFLYAMLKKDFEFPKVFDQLENGTFGEYQDVRYFGINSSTDESVRNQVKVMYYQSKDDFAIKLVTKENEEVIISKGNKKTTFGEAYQEILNRQEKYDDTSYFGKRDTLKIPNISFNMKEEIEEVQNRSFLFASGESYHIAKAIQTIEFELDRKGGKIKSEAGMDVKNDSVMLEPEPRDFLVDDTFMIFLKEQGKDLPYFGAQITDITNCQ